MKSTKEMIAVVQHYINCRKGVTPQIKIESFRDVALLTTAYNIAIEWFKMNELNIKNE